MIDFTKGCALSVESVVNFRIICVFVWCLLLLLGCTSPSSSPSEVFQQFEAVCESGETQRIDSLVSQGTRKYFEKLQAWIVRGDEESMKALTPFDRYMVLSIRMRLDFLNANDWKDWDDYHRLTPAGFYKH